jgi:murein L,D-transpeptidase YafK
VIEKARRAMVLLSHGKVLRSYKVALGKNPVGPKTRQGDMRTPEGLYTIDARYPKSEFHMALHISYPNAADRAQAKRLGVDPGGDILIHGLPNGQGYIGKAHRLWDWTKGCIAVTDEEIEEIWRLVPNGTAVEIRP